MTYKFTQGGDANGTSLQGHITATYDELTSAFGEPTYCAERDGGFDKVWTEWTLTFEDGTVACIYDWKESSPFTSRTNTVYKWNIGGKDWRAEELVGDVFANAHHKASIYA